MPGHMALHLSHLQRALVELARWATTARSRPELPAMSATAGPLDPAAQLAELFRQLYTPAELRWFLRTALGEEGRRILLNVPETGTSASEQHLAIADALVRRGHADVALFDALRRDVPGRRRLIDETQARLRRGG